MLSAESSVVPLRPSPSGVGAPVALPKAPSPGGAAALNETSASLLKFQRYRFRIPLIAASLLTSVNASAAAPAEICDSNKNNVTINPYIPCDEHYVEAIDSGSASPVTQSRAWIAAWANLTVSSRVSAFARLQADLEVLEDGWNGEASRAPSEYVKSDLRAIADMLADSRPPEIEVDDDGSISLRWEGGSRMLALTLHGNGRAIGTIYPRTSNFPCEMPVRNRAVVKQFLAMDEVRESLS